MSSAVRLFDEVKAGLPHRLRDLIELEQRGVHLAVMREPYLSMLLKGEKTIESRFSKNRVEPFERVHSGDVVVLKAGAVVGAFVVDDTTFLRLYGADVAELRREYDDRICANDEFWEMKADARFCSLLTVGEVVPFPSFAVSKRDMRGWVVLRAADRELTLAW